LFLCGHKSPYGLAHLEPLVKSRLNIRAIVLATDNRWSIFREVLGGKSYYPHKNSATILLKKIKDRLKRIIPDFILYRIKRDGWQKINVERIGKKYKIPVWHIDDVNRKEFIEKVRENKVDLIVSAAYPQVLSGTLIAVPTMGAVNFHPSLLPKFRGAHPHYWAIVKGETESGLSAHFMTENIDDGDIIAQIRFPIKDYDYKQLYEKIIRETSRLVCKIEEFFQHNTGSIIKQDPQKATYFRNDREIHHRIFWNKYTVREIFNLIRGGNAFSFYRNQKIIIEKCFITQTNRNLTNSIEVENGIIVDIDKDYIAVKTKSGIINIQELIYRNRRLHVSKFARKYRPLVGERFD